MRNLRSGVMHFADLPSGARAQVTIPVEQVRALLHEADPDARAVGLEVAERLDPGRFLAELRELAPAADRPTRRRIAGLLARAPAEPMLGLLDELLASDDLPSWLIALQTMLARADVAPRARALALAVAPDRSVAALAKLVAAGPGRIAVESGPLVEIVPWCRDAEVAADIVDACALAKRTDLADLLIAALETAPPEQQRQGLAVLPGLVSGDHAGAAALTARLAQHGDAQLRAEAVAALGAVADTADALRALGDALGDPSRLVRQRAAAALAAKGNRAIPIAAALLDATDPGVVAAAIATLGRIGSRGAIRTLSALLAPNHRDGIRNLGWLRKLPRGPEHGAWLALELALLDHNRRIVDLVLNVVAALGAARKVSDLRHSLAAADRRTRANALEALLALPQRRLVRPILPLLEAAYTSELPVARPPEAVWSDPAEILAAPHEPWTRGSSAAPPTPRALWRRRSGQRAWLGGASWCRHRHHGYGARHGAVPAAEARRPVPLFADGHAAGGEPRARAPAISGRRHDPRGRDALGSLLHAESGAVNLFANGRAAERLIGPAYFGELILVDDRVRSPRVVAACDCVLLRLHRIVFQDLSREYPDMLMELCKLLARRLSDQAGGAG